MPTNRPQPQNFSDWMRDSERRMAQVERHGQIRSAKQLLGPGFGPYAMELQDWNSPDAIFTGQFFSRPGGLNSPDTAEWWVGETLSVPEGHGVQFATRIVTGASETFSRRFSSLTGTVTFESWA